ncbi:hypothetical protein BDR03DRAFT_973757 [Suillus americanus]|nr:hypothetical protein BDR03DRAFT_973757 [Suillus americanus]
MDLPWRANWGLAILTRSCRGFEVHAMHFWRDTGLWVVRREFAPNHSPNIGIIHNDSIYRAVHLIPVYDAGFISYDLDFHHSYDFTM